MNCNHLGLVFWGNDTEEWYCKRCGITLDDAPDGWTEEDIAEAKEESGL